MADSGPAPEAGVFASLRRALATLTALVHTRLDLATTEIEEQGERLLSLLLWGVAAVFIGSAALLLCAAALVVAFWDTYRVQVAIAIAGAGVIAALLVVRGFMTRARARPRLLQATLAELAKDHERLSRK